MKRNVRGIAVHWLTGYMVLDIFSVTSTRFLISNLTQKLRKMAAVTHAQQWLGFYNKDDMFCHRLLSLKSISNKTIALCRIQSHGTTSHGTISHMRVSIELHCFVSQTAKFICSPACVFSCHLNRSCKGLFTGNTVICGSLSKKKTLMTYQILIWWLIWRL